MVVENIKNRRFDHPLWCCAVVTYLILVVEWSIFTTSRVRAHIRVHNIKEVRQMLIHLFFVRFILWCATSLIRLNIIQQPRMVKRRFKFK